MHVIYSVARYKYAKCTCHIFCSAELRALEVV